MSINISGREFNEKDKLDSVDLNLLKEAFGAVDLATDRYTKSGALVHLWHLMNDFIEFNEE